MRPPLDGPNWIALKAAFEALALQIGAAMAASKLHQAMATGRARSMRIDLATGVAEWLEPTYWLGHVIDTVIAFGSVRELDALMGYPDKHVEGFAFYVWQPDLDRLFGIAGVPADHDDRRRVRSNPKRTKRPTRAKSAPKPRKPATTPAPKRKRGGRGRSITPEQIKKGIGILRSLPTMTIEAARTTLREKGIEGSDSALYRLVIAPAYNDRDGISK